MLAAVWAWAGHAVAQPAATPAPFVCAAAPAVVRDIDAQSYYSDAAKSVVDPARYSANRAAVKPVAEFSRRIATLTDTWLRGGRDAVPAAHCAVRVLEHWARGEALLGRVTNQGGYERKWVLAGAALAWLRLADAPGIDPAAAARITHWFTQLAAAVRPHYERTDNQRTDARNNHAYWAGLAVAAGGVAAADRALIDWGIERARLGIAQIDANGALPLELARGSRALHYHLFAALPLVMSAELAAARGIDLYAEREGALHRLLARALDGVDDASWFVAQTGKPQNPSGNTISSGQLAWIEPYFARFPQHRRQHLLERYRPLAHRWLGGNLTLIYR